MTHADASAPQGALRIVRLFSSVAPGAALGGAVLGLLTTVERILLHGRIYDGLSDMALHTAWAVLVGTVGSTLFSTSIAATFCVATRWKSPPTTRSLIFLGACTGGVAGSVAFWLIVVPSRYGAVISPLPGAATVALIGAGAGAPLAVAFNHARMRTPKLTALLVSALVIGGLYVDLHRYMRAYGNAHMLLNTCLLSGAGFVGATLVCGAAVPCRRVIASSVTLISVACLLAALTFEATPGARMAVLIYGGVEKTFIRHILWSRFDGDGDGFAAVAWGADCDDDDASSSPIAWPHRSRSLGCADIATVRQPDPTQSPTLLVAKVPHSVVWIVVDTLRPDALAPVRHHFTGYTHFPGYRSCGSDTRAAISQLFGSQGCRPPTTKGSLVATLKDAGYATAAFIQYEPASLRLFPAEIVDSYGGFAELSQHDSDTALLSKAAAWLDAQKGAPTPFLALVHVWGGHSPYTGPGATPRDRYNATTSASLTAIADFIDTVPAEAIVVVMGDHGEEFGEHDGSAHGLTLYEEVLATPLLVRAASLPQGEPDCRLSCPDIVSTVHRLALGGTATPCATRGDSPLPRFARADYPTILARGPSATHLRALELPNGLKVIWDLSLDIWELYDLNLDPRETNNLARSQPRQLRDAARALFSAIETCEGRDLEAPSRSRHEEAP